MNKDLKTLNSYEAVDLNEYTTNKQVLITTVEDNSGLSSWNHNYPYPALNFKDDNNRESCHCDDGWESSDSQPKGERWPPLGAPNDEEDNISTSSAMECKLYGKRRGSLTEDRGRLKELEEEQEQLNNSLLALTSHFAQVQFRLKQIVDASPAEKETLLVELEEFANRGIPDLRQNTTHSPPLKGDPEARLDLGHERQKELISQLKQQLEDLENYAYQTGEAGVPQSIILQKQRVIIDQLKGKLNLNVDDFDKLTVDDLKLQVDMAVRELINPLRMKEQLVNQLQTQIVDLERFIEFLQDEESEPLFDESSTTKCGCEGHIQPEVAGIRYKQRRHPGRAKRTNSFHKKVEKEKLNKETENLINRATTLLSMLTFAQFGCSPSSSSFERNSLKKTASGYHWGDLRAALEISIACVCETVDLVLLEDASCSSNAETRLEKVTVSNDAITSVVRKKLCPALRDLIQHGLMPVGQSSSVVPFLSCLPQRSFHYHKLLHAWDFIVKYYHLKKGDQYNETPARKLSQSFNLEITGGTATTNKDLLLQTIGAIISSHGPLKRSYDAHFKAFISSALNKNKLITWLRLIFRTQSLVESYYQLWSYVAKTGFEDAFRSLEQLNKYQFSLPEDIAVKPFHNIKDVFN